MLVSLYKGAVIMVKKWTRDYLGIGLDPAQVFSKPKFFLPFPQKSNGEWQPSHPINSYKRERPFPESNSDSQYKFQQPEPARRRKPIQPIPDTLDTIHLGKRRLVSRIVSRLASRLESRIPYRFG